jgi:hypothetical protein
MKSLIDRIFKDGRCLDGGILKVDRFLNEQSHPAPDRQQVCGLSPLPSGMSCWRHQRIKARPEKERQ